jgi:hypothetical protein
VCPLQELPQPVVPLLPCDYPIEEKYVFSVVIDSSVPPSVAEMKNVKHEQRQKIVALHPVRRDFDPDDDGS